MYFINPLALNKHHLELLHHLLTSNKVQQYWPQECIFTLDNASIQLTHSLLLLPPVKEKLSYAIIAYHEKLGEGAFASLHPCSCIMSFDDALNVNYFFHNKYVAKIQEKACADSSQIAFCYDLAAAEYSNLRNITHLRTNIFYGYKSNNEVFSLLMMKRMLGMELFSLVEKNINDEYYIASSIKLKITLAVLTAFKKQVFDYNMFHGDIKLENIMIDLGFDLHNMPPQLDDSFFLPLVTVNFIDYAGSILFNQPIRLLVGSKGYIAPELNSSTKIITDEKADLFSLGHLLWLFWGFDQQTLLFEACDNIAHTDFINGLYDSFYAKEPEEQTKHLLHQIHWLIRGMKRDDVEQRLSLVDVLQQAHYISSQYSSRIENERNQSLSLAREMDHTRHPSTVTEVLNQPVLQSPPLFDSVINRAGEMYFGFFPANDVPKEQSNAKQEPGKISFSLTI